MITPRSEGEKKPFISPADRLIAEQEGLYYKLSEAADLVGKSQNTLRRLMRSKKVKAPSYEIKQGDMTMYLYTAEDIEEIRNYYGAQKPQKR